MNRHDTSGGDASARITPMMEQYLEIKTAHPDCLLFYRMGDFYELFFEDASVAAGALGIALTRRGTHLGEPIPMCGVPVHAADEYLQRLIGLGQRVAVCEQTEDPADARKRGGRSLVKRAVTRLVTPGTLTEERLLEAGRANHLAALTRIPASDGADRLALAWTDISTGSFRVGECAAAGLAAMLARIEPREVLAPERLAQEPDFRQAMKQAGAALTPLPASFFDALTAEQRLARGFGVRTMESFGSFSRGEIAAGAALMAYVEKTQVGSRPPMEAPRRISAGDAMRLDAATRANLELFRTVSGNRAGSLLAAVDRTRCAAGSRLLAERLANPLCDPQAIEARLDAVQMFVDDGRLRCDLREALAAAPDMLRALSRLALQRGGPRDLDCIRAGLAGAEAIAALLAGSSSTAVAAERDACAAAPHDLRRELAAALDDNLPLLKRDGGFVRRGHDERLDEARALRDESRRVIASLQAHYAGATGIKTLKIRHNNVLGYFVEVTAAQAPALTAGDGPASFVHRQSMANAMRFTTAELAELEQRIASAAERALALELAAFDRLCGQVLAEQEGIRGAAHALAALDVAAALAELAVSDSYVRPKVDLGLGFRIEEGRHPVVERALREEGRDFVGNDCDLGPAGVAAAGATAGPQGDGAGESGRIWLITGPNMAGKSTFLRQNALIAILAQAGSFVPAKAAQIGVVDAVFSRVGAADDLARGRSTFMVEMVETAAILNQAGPHSLVILDEIGRGTATFDGLSIAWAVIEHLHEATRSRTLFASHYHELTALAARLPRLHNATMKVKEWKGDVVFLHEIVAGAADRSYGIQVAKLAGLPGTVIARAREVLETLEKLDRSRPRMAVDDLPLFAVRGAAPTEPAPHPALTALAALDPDDLSPKQALEALYALKRLGREDG